MVILICKLKVDVENKLILYYLKLKWKWMGLRRRNHQKAQVKSKNYLYSQAGLSFKILEI